MILHSTSALADNMIQVKRDSQYSISRFYIELFLDCANDEETLTLVGVDVVEDGVQVIERAREHPLVTETAPAPAHIAVLDTGHQECLLIYPPLSTQPYCPWPQHITAS